MRLISLIPPPPVQQRCSRHDRFGGRRHSPYCRSPGGGPAPGGSYRPFHQQILDLADRLRRVESLRTDIDAIHDRVAPEQPVRVLQVVEPLVGRLVARICNEAIGLEQTRRADELVGIPPERRTRGGATRAEYALVE